MSFCEIMGPNALNCLKYEDNQWIPCKAMGLLIYFGIWTQDSSPEPFEGQEKVV